MAFGFVSMKWFSIKWSIRSEWLSMNWSLAVENQGEFDRS
jgi:hypothetical protein